MQGHIVELRVLLLIGEYLYFATSILRQLVRSDHTISASGSKVSISFGDNLCAEGYAFQLPSQNAQCKQYLTT